LPLTFLTYFACNILIKLLKDVLKSIVIDRTFLIMKRTKALAETKTKITGNKLQLKLENCEREERGKDRKSERNGKEKGTSLKALSHSSRESPVKLSCLF